MANSKALLPSGGGKVSTLSPKSPSPLSLSLTDLLFCVIPSHSLKYTCAQFCQEAVTYCDQLWKSDREPNYIALTSAPPSVRILTNKYKADLWLYHIHDPPKFLYEWISTKSQFYLKKNKAGGKVLHLIRILLNIIYILLLLMGSIHISKILFS